jgi:hypothetical protein
MRPGHRQARAPKRFALFAKRGKLLPTARLRFGDAQSSQRWRVGSPARPFLVLIAAARPGPLHFLEQFARAALAVKLDQQPFSDKLLLCRAVSAFSRGHCWSQSEFKQ